MTTFSFSFSGEDIEEDSAIPEISQHPKHAAETGTLHRQARSTAFPVAGQPGLQPQRHELTAMLQALPSKVSYGNLMVTLDDGSLVDIPRRELWDVRVQLMAEGDDEGLGNLGKDDVKTGVYEGGFKSWESSVDLVKVLGVRRERVLGTGAVGRRLLEVRGLFFPCFDDGLGSWEWSLVELVLILNGADDMQLGCGTALPSLAAFQWQLQQDVASTKAAFHLSLADYNPSVLQLVTLPNILLSWAQFKARESWELEGELEINPELIEAFISDMVHHNITLSFFSGAWSPEFVDNIKKQIISEPASLTVIGAETIYSPMALKSFAETLMAILAAQSDHDRTAFVAAKKVYFGVGGSIEDFCDLAREMDAVVEQVREESDGVRRTVVEVGIASNVP